MPETGISAPEAKIAVPGPILLILVSKYMFFGSGNPFLPLAKLYSGQEFKASEIYVSANLIFELQRPLGTPPKVATKIFFREKLLNIHTKDRKIFGTHYNHSFGSGKLKTLEGVVRTPPREVKG